MEVTQNIVKDQLDIIYRPHPILPAADCKYLAQQWSKGTTVRKILIENGIDQYQPISITIDDRLLTVQEWDTICPNPGQIINVKAEVEGGGGGGGSNPLQIVAMIALVVIVSYFTLGTGTLTAASMFGVQAGGWAAAAMGGAIMIAGSLAINAIFSAQMPAVDLGNVSGSSIAQTSPTYSISGGQNRLRPYESMSVLMGQHRVFFDLASKPFTEYASEDQYLYQIFHRGLSYADFTNYKIGNNALTNYKDYHWEYPAASGKIPNFPGNVDSAPGAVLEKSAGWITRTTSINTYKIGLDIEGTLYYANDSGGLDSTSVQLRVEYRPVGTTTWLQPSTIYRSGVGFATGSYKNYYVIVSRNYGWWNNNTTTTEISLSQYNAYKASWGGTSSPYTEDSWSQSWIEIRKRFVAGSGNTIIISGKSQAQRRASLSFTPSTPGQFEVRVIRDTNDSTNARLQNSTNWSVIKSYQLDNGDYKGQNRVGIVIRASEQLNGVIQQLSAVGKSAAYYWDGSAFVTKYTQNPAHWFMHFALGQRNEDGKLMYGVGLNESQIDFDALHAWATFCTTEGLTFNAVIDGSQTCADILSAIARCGFASPTWASGKLGVVWDARNASPVAAFGMSNIIKGSFNVNYITENLAEEIIVKYINPSNDWQQDEVRVVVPNITSPARSSTIDLFGCTSKTMAGKFANYMAAQQYYRRRRVSWDCDFEGFVCNRGDVVLLSHDLTQWGYSGRVISVNADKITLDRNVPRNGSIEYVMLKRPDGSMSTYEVTAASGESDELTLTDVPDFQEGYLPMDHIWFFSPLETPGKKVKILSVQPVSDSRVQIVATDEYEEFYSAWDGSWIEPPVNTLLKNTETPAIENLSISERLAVVGTGEVVTRVTIGWNQKSSQVERVQVRYWIDDSEYRSTTVYGVTNVEVDFDGAGTVYAEAFPINGTVIGETIEGSKVVYGKTLPPSVPTGLVTSAYGNQVLINWADNPELDLAGYEVRSSDADWGSSGYLFKGNVSQFVDMAPAYGDIKTWYVKSYDTSGNYSETAATVTFTPDAVTDVSGFTYTFHDTSTTASTITLDWDAVETQFGVDYYEVIYNLTVKQVKASTITIDANWVGDRTFTVKVVDLNGNRSSGYSSVVTKLLPSTPASGSARVDNGVLSLDWADAARTTLPVWGYEVRKDTLFGTSGFVFKGAGSQCSVGVDSLAIGLNVFYIKTIDTDGNYSDSYLTVNHTYFNVYDIASLNYLFADTSLTNATITLDWNDVVPQYGLGYYELSYDSVVKNVNASTITVPANWIGNRDFTVKVVDINGFKSSGYTISVNKSVPNAPIGFRASVIDNTVMLYWTLPAKTTLPISHALLKKGSSWASAVSIGNKAGEFTVVNESSGGTFTYWLALVDTDGYESSPVQVTAKVSEPPDFVFHGSFDSTFSGTKNSAMIEQGVLVMPVNITETWQGHFTTRGWTTPQDQINAGYPIYIQPGTTSGYYQETFDFGTILASSKVTVSYGYNTVSGSPTIVSKIETSDDNATWVVNDGVTEVFATNFRYVRVTITVTGVDTMIMQLTSLNCRCDAKQMTDAGSASAVSTDVNGTIVNFNKQFIDVDAITLTPSSTTPLTAVYDFQDYVSSGTYSVSSNVITVNVTGHGLVAGQKVRLGVSTGTAPSGVVTISTTTTNSFTAALTTANTSGNLSIYPESFRVYLFNSSGTRVSGTVSWNVRGY